MGPCFFCLFLLAGGVHGSLLFSYGGQESKDCSGITDRFDKLECVVLQQDARLSHQENLLYQQDAKLTHQGNLLSLQANLLHQQDAKVTHQENLLSHQASLLHHQNTKLSDQENLSRQQAAEVSHLKTLLRQQNSKLSRQEHLLLQQDKLLQKLFLKLKFQEHSGNKQAEREMLFSSYPVSDNTNTSNPGTLNRNEMSTSASHDVIARSDDGGPLEAVVSQISQQVTEMNADIQAFKTQTATDIQTLQAQTSADIQTLKTSNTQQNQDIQNAQSSTFVHWGSAQCDSSSQLVYSGVVGGSWYDHSGSATSYLCLTMSPVFSSLSPPEPYVAYLYGTEYETQHDAHHNKDAVCAVCRSTFPTTIMIPGTNVCTPGWHRHYSGYLMSKYYNDPTGTEYICVDSHLESSAHSEANQNGATLFYTVTRCGSLPCSPYVNDKVVTCVVCGK